MKKSERLIGQEEWEFIIFLFKYIEFFKGKAQLTH